MSLEMFLLVLFGVLLNAGAQLLIKAGMEKIGHFAFEWSNFTPIVSQIAANPYIFIGLLFYVISVCVWMLVLSRVDVSIAYPMLSIGYVVNAIIAYYWLGEQLSMMRFTGIFIILIGVFILAKA